VILSGVASLLVNPNGSTTESPVSRNAKINLATPKNRPAPWQRGPSIESPSGLGRAPRGKQLYQAEMRRARTSPAFLARPHFDHRIHRKPPERGLSDSHRKSPSAFPLGRRVAVPPSDPGPVHRSRSRVSRQLDTEEPKFRLGVIQELGFSRVSLECQSAPMNSTFLWCRLQSNHVGSWRCIITQ
jgi:hypothetical protein